MSLKKKEFVNYLANSNITHLSEENIIKLQSILCNNKNTINSFKKYVENNKSLLSSENNKSLLFDDAMGLVDSDNNKNVGESFDECASLFAGSYWELIKDGLKQVGSKMGHNALDMVGTALNKGFSAVNPEDLFRGVYKDFKESINYDTVKVLGTYYDKNIKNFKTIYDKIFSVISNTNSNGSISQKIDEIVNNIYIIEDTTGSGINGFNNCSLGENAVAIYGNNNRNIPDYNTNKDKLDLNEQYLNVFAAIINMFSNYLMNDKHLRKELLNELNKSINGSAKSNALIKFNDRVIEHKAENPNAGRFELCYYNIFFYSILRPDITNAISSVLYTIYISVNSYYNSKNMDNDKQNNTINFNALKISLKHAVNKNWIYNNDSSNTPSCKDIIYNDSNNIIKFKEFNEEYELNIDDKSKQTKINSDEKIINLLNAFIHNNRDTSSLVKAMKECKNKNISDKI